MESEEHYVCHGAVSYEITGRYHCLFKKGFGPVCKVTEYEDQQCLGLSLLELERHKGMLKDNKAIQAHQQQIITTF